MTVSNTVVKNVYLGNGSTTVWPYTFALNTEDGQYVQVIITDEAGVETDVTQFATIDTNIRTVTYPNAGTPLPAGRKIVLKRIIPYTQELNLESQGPFFAEDIEAELDRIVMMIQQADEALNRSVKLDISSTMTPEEFIADIKNAHAESVQAAINAAESEGNAAQSEQAAAGYAATIEGHIERVEKIEQDLDAASKYLGARATVYDVNKTYVPADVVMLPSGTVYRCLITSTGEDPAMSYKWQEVSCTINDTFELDINQDIMPRLHPKTASHWEVDANEDIMPYQPIPFIIIR